MTTPLDLRFATVRARYQTGVTPPELLVELARADHTWNDPALWIRRLTPNESLDLPRESGASAPLAGLPFAIKDNIDLAGVPTTAACPSFSAEPAPLNATVVSLLLRAGAIPLGKTNLDQFATGLVGVRSPYGTPRNPFDPAYLPGGSSSGSAVAVAAGLASFALGTDTAGSGRVPAAFNELVGLKPTRGLVSTRGVVPACRSLDCVSVFTRTVNDAADVLRVVAQPDRDDPMSRPCPPTRHRIAGRPRLGVPAATHREFFGDHEAESLFEAAVSKARGLGWDVIEVDDRPFRETAQLLYGGPWVAERYASVGVFLEQNLTGLDPTTTRIILGGKAASASAAFQALERLAVLRRAADAVWQTIDVLMTPTTPTVYRCDEVAADPINLNSRLGTYTNHFNLLDLCGLALPAGRWHGRLPWGITLAAPAFHDDILLSLGAAWMGEPCPPLALEPQTTWTELVVCGAHLQGLPLNGQLVERGARLVRATRTSPHYALSALPGTVPPKPALRRVAGGGGAIEVEVWRLPVARLGDFVRLIPPPLGIGTIELADGTQAQGFLAEALAAEAGEDITSFGGWRAYLARR